MIECYPISQFCYPISQFCYPFEIKKAYFNDPVTVVIWNDGTKTIVRCQEGDTYDRQTGLLMCIAKKAYGNNSSFNDILREWVWEEEKASELESKICHALGQIFGVK